MLVGKLILDGQPAQSFEEHVAAIRHRQAQIDCLNIHQNGVSAHYGGELSKGCLAGQQGKWVAVFVGHACNATCSFCPQAPKPRPGQGRDCDGKLYTSFGAAPKENMKERILDAILRGNITAVAYSGGEPLLYMDRLLSLADSVIRLSNYTYQYLYTNGILLSDRRCRQLRDVGVEEVRVDLAATDFSEKALRNLERAAKIFPRVAVEVPSTRGIHVHIQRHSRRLQAVGVAQINLCEVVINEHNYIFFRGEPYYVVNPYENDPYSRELIGADLWRYRRAAPVWSRHETYDVLAAAFKESWQLTVNDIAQVDHFKPAVPM